MKKEIVAVGDYCTIKKITESSYNVNGVEVPMNSQNLMSKAEVLSVGDGKDIARLGLQKGDVIIYNEIENNAHNSEDGFGNNLAVYIVGHKFIYARYKRDNE